MPDPEDVGGIQDIVKVNNCIREKMPFNTFMTKFFEGSNTEELIQCMFVHMKT